MAAVNLGRRSYTEAKITRSDTETVDTGSLTCFMRKNAQRRNKIYWQKMHEEVINGLAAFHVQTNRATLSYGVMDWGLR